MPQDENGNSLPAVDGPISRPQSPDVAAHWLKAVIESADDAVITKTLEGVITSWNPGARRVFGYTADEVIGKSVTILIPEDHIDEEPAILARIRRGERVEHYETVRRRKDGSLVDMLVTVSTLLEDRGRPFLQFTQGAHSLNIEHDFDSVNSVALPGIKHLARYGHLRDLC